MEFDGTDISLTEDSLFDSRKPTKVVAHGWGGGLHIDKIFAQAYAAGGLDYNVIGIDWRNMEGSAKQQVVAVGVHAAHFIEVLVRDHGLLLQDVHAIGFSYGAHVVGKLGHFSISYQSVPTLKQTMSFFRVSKGTVNGQTITFKPVIDEKSVILCFP